MLGGGRGGADDRGVGGARRPRHCSRFAAGGENALSLETLEQLADAAEALAADPAVRMVAVTGGGHAHLLVRRRPEGARGPAGRGGRRPRRRRPGARSAALEVPTVALLNGHVVGGGIDLALACDWRIAVEGAKLRFIHNELGFTPPWGALARLVALVPARRRAAAVRDVRARLGAGGAADGHRRRGRRAPQAHVPGRVAGRPHRPRRPPRAGRDQAPAGAPASAHEEHARAFAALWDARAATLPA